ncbi:MAG: glycosyltransferase [Chitinophagales bacterium]
MIGTILLSLSLIIFIYLFFSSLYLFVFALAGRLIKGKIHETMDQKKTIAVIIPSYKEDHIIVDTARQAFAHDYPSGFFSVFVVADKLQPTTIERLRQIPVRVIEVDVDMKSRSIHAALEAIDKSAFDMVVILDADNVMKPGCLEKVNSAFQMGYRALQCHRIAKNENTPIATLDAISEGININLFRRGPARLKLSAAPLGSGMAFDIALISEIFSVERILNNPGEDREIDMQLLKKNIFMEFVDDAWVLDEKVASTAVFEKQRVRWLEAQFAHIRRFFDPDMRSLSKTTNFFNKFFQTLLLPRVLMMAVYGLVCLILLTGWIFGLRTLFPAPSWWLTGMLLYLLALVISVPFSHYNVRTVKAIAYIPILALSMLKALVSMKKNRKEFLHTPKTFGSD